MIITHNTAIAPIAQRIFHLKDGVIDKVEVNRHPISPEEVRCGDALEKNNSDLNDNREPVPLAW